MTVDGLDQATRWPLQGREAELAAFEGALTDRRGQGFMVYGSAGVGKSRLAEECLALAVHGGLRGGRAVASTALAAVPLGAIAHLLPAGVDMSNPVAGFAAVGRALAGQGQAGKPERKRWVIFVDDLHLLDATSAMLLRQLMDAGAIRLIGTIRSGERLGEAVEALGHSDAVRRVVLAELDERQVEALLARVLEGPIGRRTVHELFTASGGNVLYLRELVLGALGSGALSSDGEVWELAEGRLLGTPRLAELIEARLAAAGAAGRPVLEVLALCGPLSLTDVRSVADLQILTDLERAGLLRVIEERRRADVALAHPLYGEVLRDGIPAQRFGELLLQQAQRIEAHGARRRADLLRIASWRLAATGTADTSLLLQAAVLARHAHDYPHVISLLQAVPAEHQTTATRLLHGEALFELGQNSKAEAVLAKADAQVVGEEDKLLVTNIRSTNLFWGAARTAKALAVNEAARTQVTSAAGRQVLHTIEGAIRIASGQFEQGMALLNQLGADVEQAPDINTWLHGASLKTMGLALMGRTSEAVKWAEDAYSANLRVDKQALRPPPATQLAPLVVALSEAGKLAEAREVGERAFADLVAARAPVPEIWTALFIARAELMAGHCALARHWYAESAALCRAHHQTRALRPVLAGLAASAVLLDDRETAEATWAEATTHPPFGMFTAEECLAEAWLQAARGQQPRARAVLVDAAEAARDMGHFTSEALLLTDIARLGGANDVTDRLTELTHTCDGAFAPARAHLAAALAASAPIDLLDVTSELEVIGADLLAAEAATAAATTWQQAGESRRATAAATRAEAAASRCPGLRTPLLATAIAAIPLTPREQQVAQLAVTGATSKDIATALTLSVRTVDNHFRRIYGKLGVTSRQELAHALRRGADAPMDVKQ